MRLNARFFGLAAAVVAAVTFVICAVVVAVAPGTMQGTLSYVLHVDLTQMTRTISATSFFVGLVVFAAFFFVCAYCIAALYNALLERQAREATVHPALAKG
ncbi:MAG: DUF5676 family membrane protein [Gemmatimonadaceae bacterium]